jgi:hypothetical protein
MAPLMRTPQLRAAFTPQDPTSGYYNDLRVFVAERAQTPAEGASVLEQMTSDRRLANPVSIAQLGLGAWQSAGDDERWLDVTHGAAHWLAAELAPAGRLEFRFPVRSTYRIDPPWISAMAQGEAASLLVRAATTFDDPGLLELAGVAVGAVLDEGTGLVSATGEGPVLQEYPTSPPAHVLNGWIYALWGLYDVAHATGSARHAAAFEEGVATLVARLPRYRTRLRWSLYDLYPHPVANVASPYYHRLHAELLASLDIQHPHPTLQHFAAAWSASSSGAVPRAVAVARKGIFRFVRPRRGAR